MYVFPVVQVYFVLLLRSQVIKLENSGEFRLNNTAEAQCMMTSKEKGAEAENVWKEGIELTEEELQQTTKSWKTGMCEFETEKLMVT